MKYLATLALLLFVFTQGTHSQTLQSYTATKDTTPNNLPKGSVWFVCEDSGSVWIAGDSALVARADTGNLGSWTLLNTGIPPTNGLNWLEFINTSTIFAAGIDGTIYETTNGGGSWNSVYYNPSLTNFIDRITFFDANNGMAWGDGVSSTSIQACLQTTDGGATWTNNNSHLIGFASYQIVRFVPPSNVFVVGFHSLSDSYHGIWRSTDLGASWSYASIGTSSKDSVTKSNSVDFKNSLVGVASRDDSTIWSTSDGGVTWQQVGSKAQTALDYVQFVKGTNTVIAGGVGEATIAASDPDANAITLYRDTSKTVSFGFVSFPTLTRGYMANGLTRTFYSATFVTPLPVELTAFTATGMISSVVLNWTTATETNNSGFEIEQKSSADWTTLGFVAGHGTSNASHRYSYVVSNVSPGRSSYRLKQIDRDGNFKYSQTVEATVGTGPKDYGLSQNYPEPFNPSTTISYDLPTSSRVKLTIYDILGHNVATLVNEQKEAGSYSVQWNASNVASGVYFYRLEAGSFLQTKKLVLLK